MRFDNFPLELKRIIFSYFSPHELREKVSPVSKEWDILARDTFNWRNVEFFSDRDCIQSVSKVLRGTRVEKITFHNYDFHSFNLTAFPVLNSVKEIKFTQCGFRDSDVLRILVQCFPNIRKFSRDIQPKDEDDDRCLYELKDNLKYLQQLRNLKSIELHRLDIFSSNSAIGGLMKQDHHLEELIISWSGISTISLDMIIDRHGQHLQILAVDFDDCPSYVYRKLSFCRNLKRLSLLIPQLLTNDEFILIIRELKLLAYLRVECAPKLFSNGFEELCNDVILHQLQELILGNCSKLTDDYLTIIVKSSPLLKHLTLRSLKQITDKGLESFPNVARKLKILHLEFMRCVTKRCLIKISRALPNLREVVAKDCPQVSHETKYCIFYD